jgi:hypothetical protein
MGALSFLIGAIAFVLRLIEASIRDLGVVGLLGVILMATGFVALAASWGERRTRQSELEPQAVDHDGPVYIKRSLLERAAEGDAIRFAQLRSRERAAEGAAVKDLSARLNSLQDGQAELQDTLEAAQRRRKAHPYTRLANDFEAFVVAARSTQPGHPTPGDIFDPDEMREYRNAQMRYREAFDRWWRETIGEYHQRFRARVMEALKWAKSDVAALAGEPHDLGQLQKLQTGLELADLRVEHANPLTRFGTRLPLRMLGIDDQSADVAGADNRRLSWFQTLWR